MLTAYAVWSTPLPIAAQKAVQDERQRPEASERKAPAVTFAFIVSVANDWKKFDVGTPLKALFINQATLLCCWLVAMWRATVLWVRVRGAVAFPWRIEGHRPATYAVGRWRRRASYIWWALVANMVLTAVLL